MAGINKGNEPAGTAMLYYLPGCSTNRNHKTAGRKTGAEGNIIPQRPSFLPCPKSRSLQYLANHSFVCSEVDCGIESHVVWCLLGAYCRKNEH